MVVYEHVCKDNVETEMDVENGCVVKSSVSASNIYEPSYSLQVNGAETLVKQEKDSVTNDGKYKLPNVTGIHSESNDTMQNMYKHSSQVSSVKELLVNNRHVNSLKAFYLPDGRVPL